MSTDTRLCINTKNDNTNTVDKPSKKTYWPHIVPVPNTRFCSIAAAKRMPPNQNILHVDQILTAQLFGCVFIEAYSTTSVDQLFKTKTTFYK